MSISAFHLLKAALNQSHTFTVFSSLCKRVRFRKSDCQKCVVTCPEKTISLNPGPIIGSHCTDCGLCQNVCPTEAFQNQFFTDLHLLNQMKSFLEKRGLSIHCSQAESQKNLFLSILCLGRMSENIPLGAALLGFDELLLMKGNCSRCHFEQGEKLLAHSLRASSLLLKSLGLGDFSIRLIEKEGKAEDHLSRREIFSKISNGVKNRVEKVLKEKMITASESVIEKKPPPRREVLLKLLKQKDWRDSMLVKYQPDLPWGKIRIDDKNCSGCEICSALCPTGALFKKSDEKCQLISFNSSSCINCSLCKEACPKKAIDFEEHFLLPDLLTGGPLVVARIPLGSCIVCGEMTAAGESICSTCQKRQTGFTSRWV